MGCREYVQQASPLCAAILLVVLGVVWWDSVQVQERTSRLQDETAVLRRSRRLTVDSSETPAPPPTPLPDSLPAPLPTPTPPEAAPRTPEPALTPAPPPQELLWGTDTRAAVAAGAEPTFGNVSTEVMYSAAHCVGGEPGRARADPDAWRRMSCHYRNLCFDPQARDFVYLRAPTDDYKQSAKYLALGAINAQWDAQHAQRARWAPRAVDVDPASMPPYRLVKGEVLVPHIEHCAANVMHLIMDQFLPWYALVTLFDLRTAKMRPIRVPASPEPLWGSCDFIRGEEARGEAWARGYPKRCDSNLARWLPCMLPEKRTLLETDRVRGKSDLPQRPFAEGAAELRCFEHAVAGVGVLSDHCLRSHGWGWDSNDRTIHDCNQGRGATLWGFRAHMLSVSLGGQPPAPVRHRVALLVGGHRAFAAWKGWTLAVRQQHEQRGAEIWTEDLARMPAAQQLRQLSQATVCVAAMGGNAVSALFLPRGSGLIVSGDGKDFLDWDLWAHSSWMRVTWVTSSTPGAEIAALVGREMRRYEAFRQPGAAFTVAQ